METFTKRKDLIPNPDFNEQRISALINIDYNEIDVPIIELIKNISKLDFCFSLQSCYGHFFYQGESDQHNIKQLPILNENISINYRIAYVTMCMEENPQGEKLLDDLAKLQLFEPKYIQFGCAEWFWKRQINSFVIQVEPERFMCSDRCVIDYKEALYIENVRNYFLKKLSEIIVSLIEQNYS